MRSRQAVQTTLRAALALLLLAGSSALNAAAQNVPPDANTMTNAAASARKNFVTGVVNLEFSNYHLTSRGINLQNQGLIFQPLVRLDWNLYQNAIPEKQTLNEFTFTTAAWNDIDSEKSGVRAGNWNEVDFIFGPNVRVFDDWTLEMPFIAYKSETGSYDTCWAWDPRLTYHDHFIKHFSINPYVEFYWEMKNKITVVFAPEKSKSSYYGVIGMTPTYTFDKLPLKLELPTYVIIPGNDFYQRADGSGGGTDIGLVTTMLKATVPLKFISPAYGQWSIYAGVQYDYLNNPGLLDGNEFFGAANSRERNLVVFHGGMTVRF